jgi:phosphate uptake regulator
MIYRPHRGGLRESLELAKEFKTEEEMKQFIYESYKKLLDDNTVLTPFDIEDIVIKYDEKTDDNRCGWHDTMYVCVKRFYNQDYIKEYGCPQCIGMCATNYEKRC